jgi:serine/threonine protein kinase
MFPDSPAERVPLDEDEVLLAEFLEQAFERLRRGETARAAELLAHTPRLIDAGERLLGEARDLFGAALGLQGRAQLLESVLRERAEYTEAAPAQELATPDPFPDEFRIARLLGQGACGTVWLAEDRKLGRPVALKMVRTGEAPRVTAELLERLGAEARLLAAVRHPNVVQIHAWREWRPAGGAPVPCLVLQYVPGGSLAERVRQEGPLPWPTAARYVADAAEGLLNVHRAGIVHRDVKPSNLLWDSEHDEALLTDFGLSARLAEATGAAGTPYFMAPEAFDGHSSPAMDVYGLAASLFWLVTGFPPFVGLTAAGVQRQARRGLPETDARCVGMPRALEQLIRAGLAADPARRPELCEFAAALRGCLNQLLADTLLLEVGPERPAPVRLALSVLRQVEARNFRPVAASHPAPERLVRDLKRVPPEPASAEVFTGQRVRIEAEADRPGYLTVFNVGPTGNLNVLYPEPEGGRIALAGIEAGRPVCLLDIVLTPPAGPERVFALWSVRPLVLDAHELQEVAREGQPSVSASYRATRDMKRLQETLRQLGEHEWHVTVLNLNHLPAQEILP